VTAVNNPFSRNEGRHAEGQRVPDTTIIHITREPSPRDLVQAADAAIAATGRDRESAAAYGQRPRG
jgi:hypothetical protein